MWGGEVGNGRWDSEAAKTSTGQDMAKSAGFKVTPRPSATPRGSASHPHRGEGFLSATPRTQSGRESGKAEGNGAGWKPRSREGSVALSSPVDVDGHILPNVTRVDRFDIVRALMSRDTRKFS